MDNKKYTIRICICEKDETPVRLWAKDYSNLHCMYEIKVELLNKVLYYKSHTSGDNNYTKQCIMVNLMRKLRDLTRNNKGYLMTIIRVNDNIILQSVDSEDTPMLSFRLLLKIVADLEDAPLLLA